jgi:hypothetical protein
MKTMVVLSVVLLTGCGWFDRKIVANVTGYSKTCVEGVTYLQFPSGVTTQVTLEGKPVSCN